MRATVGERTNDGEPVWNSVNLLRNDPGRVAFPVVERPSMAIDPAQQSAQSTW
jgi:hypothetical protein